VRSPTSIGVPSIALGQAWRRALKVPAKKYRWAVVVAIALAPSARPGENEPLGLMVGVATQDVWAPNDTLGQGSGARPRSARLRGQPGLVQEFTTAEHLQRWPG
jgi:hypothetical protein